jgi:hypothetical protein
MVSGLISSVAFSMPSFMLIIEISGDKPNTFAASFTAATDCPIMSEAFSPISMIP